MSAQQSPHERWNELRDELDKLATKRNWRQFECLLPKLFDVAKHGQYVNLMEAIFDEEPT